MSSAKGKPSKRKAAAGQRVSKGPSAVTKKPRKPKGMVELPVGIVLTDLTKKRWCLGRLIGWGGFGALYLASPDNGSAVDESAGNVVKVEPHTNGPLFTELGFYKRVAKPDLIASWCKSHRLKHLGVPAFLGSGSLEYSPAKLRFLVMDRFGKDVDELFISSDRRFHITTVLMLGLRILDILEYIHFHGYAHGDIKGSNLMMGFPKSKTDQVYLLDYGLVYRFNPEGNHKEYKEDPKRRHDGTVAFTSRDAHNGVVPARRCDLEILGYVMLQWLCDRLPWEKNLSDKEYVQNEKIRYMDDIPQLMRDCFHGDHPPEIQKYIQYVNTLKYEQEPDYEHLRKLFKDGLKKRGCIDDGKSVKFKSGKESSTSSILVASKALHNGDAEEEREASKRRKPAVAKSRKRPSEDAIDTSPSKKLRRRPRKGKAKETGEVSQPSTAKRPRAPARRKKAVM